MQKYLLNKYFIFIVILFPAILFGQTEPVPQQQIIEMELFENSDIPSFTGYGNCQWLRPLDEPNETLLEQPDYKSEKLYYYAAKYGDADDNIYTIILDESQGTGKGYDTVYVDLDNDNRIDSETERLSFKLGTTSQAVPLRIKLAVSAGGKKIPYCFNFTAFQYTDDNNPVEKIHATARNSSIFTGRANFDGRDYKIGIADLDSNGLFNDVEQGLFQGDRFFVDFDGDGKFHDSPKDLVESFSYGKYTKIKEKWYTIQASADGMSIQISPASPDIVTIRAPKGVSAVSLHSAVQSLRLNFSEGKAEAVSGTYRLADMELSMTESQKHIWITHGRFREDPLEINLAQDKETILPEVLPFTVSIEPSGKSPFEEVTFTAKIITSIGGVFRTPRESGRSNGGFEVQDADGKTFASATFEFG